MQTMPTPCDSCLRRLTDDTCEAFSKGIPEAILVWGDNHAEPIPNQGNELAWVFRPGSENEFQVWKEFQEQPVQ
jgi:hypothetical protein